MKNLFKLSLLNSAISLRDCLGKFICKLSSLKNEENPSSGNLDAADYFTSHQHLADYLKCSVNTVKVYKRTGVIPFTIIDGRSWSKKEDVEKVIELHPNIASLFNRSAKKHPELMRVTTNCVKLDETWCFIYLSFQGWKPQIMAPISFMEDKELLQYVCDKAILFRHKIKPFRYNPTFNRNAA
jgi:hypothetical protein